MSRMACFAASLLLLLLASSASSAPTLSDRTPSVNAKGVHPLAAATLTFGASVTAQPALLIELRSFDTHYVFSSVAAVSSYVNIVGSIVTITFPVTEVPSGKVYISIEAGAFQDVTDSSNFAGIAAQAWPFEIESELLCAVLPC
jgi:hypothetical protein